ncbi:MAG: hypothetical protein Q9221_002133 [Calogaya cf. arnoldii]
MEQRITKFIEDLSIRGHGARMLGPLTDASRKRAAPGDNGNGSMRPSTDIEVSQNHLQDLRSEILELKMETESNLKKYQKLDQKLSKQIRDYSALKICIGYRTLTSTKSSTSSLPTNSSSTRAWATKEWPTGKNLATGKECRLPKEGVRCPKPLEVVLANARSKPILSSKTCILAVAPLRPVLGQRLWRRPQPLHLSSWCLKRPRMNSPTERFEAENMDSRSSMTVTAIQDTPETALRALSMSVVN